MKFLDSDFETGFWTGEKLGREIAIDTETSWKTSESEVTDLVTMQVYDGSDRVYFVDRPNIKEFFEIHENSSFIFHNAAFDIDVIIKTEQQSKEDFATRIEKSQIWDTSILYRLWKLATTGNIPFKYNLKLLTSEFLGTELDKDEEVRGNFGDYLDQGITYWEEMPDEFIEYAAKDAIATFLVYQKLKEVVYYVQSHSHLTHLIQLVGDISLNRMTRRGIGFDQDAKNQMVEQIREAMDSHADILASYGWARGLKGIQERYEAIVRDMLELDLPKTEDGQISMKSEDLEPYIDSHPFIAALVHYLELEKKLQYIEPLTGARIHPKYNLIMNTGRTSANKPNIQNPPRQGGIRELFVPKPGHLFAIVDYAFVELCTLAQTAYIKYGHSSLRDAINKGIDPHKYYASVMSGKPVSDITKEERQYAKAANFGFPGGLGVEKFTQYASTSYNVHLTPQEASKMKDIWFKAYPEMRAYMNENSSDTWTLTGRKRADASYCAAKNTPFQGLAADGAKIALWNLEKAGFNAVAFIHDEIICEVPIESAEKDLLQIKNIMIESMEEVCPDVKIAVDGHLTDRWRKL